MKVLFDAVIAQIGTTVEHHVGLYESVSLLETGVEAKLYSLIKSTDWHVNNTTIVPPISQSVLLTQESIILPVAIATWVESVNNWTHTNFILSIRQIPLLVTQTDVYAYVSGNLKVPDQSKEVMK